MNRQPWYLVAVVLLLWWVGLESAVAEHQPNVVVILTDDQGYGDLELFINSASPVDRKKVPMNPKANPSKMAIGQERDATNHPGHKSFHGEISRFLIYERPLSDADLSQVIKQLTETYRVP